MIVNKTLKNVDISTFMGVFPLMENLAGNDTF